MQDLRPDIRTDQKPRLRQSRLTGRQGGNCAKGDHVDATELLDQRAPAKARRAGDDNSPDILIGLRRELLTASTLGDVGHGNREPGLRGTILEGSFQVVAELHIRCKRQLALFQVWNHHAVGNLG